MPFRIKEYWEELTGNLRIKHDFLFNEIEID
jgi:hypothetical protein